MRKIVINKCYGGFSLSSEAERLLAKKANPLDKRFHFLYDIPRDHPLLVELVEELGSKCWGDHAELKVVEIPEDVEWEIIEYDGIVTIRHVL